VISLGVGMIVNDKMLFAVWSPSLLVQLWSSSAIEKVWFFGFVQGLS